MYEVLRVLHHVSQQFQGVHLPVLLVGVIVLTAVTLAYLLFFDKAPKRVVRLLRFALLASWMIFSLLLIFDFTIFSRDAGRGGVIEIVPFGGYASNHGILKYVTYDIANALLFVPFGFFCTKLLGGHFSRWAIVCAVVCGLALSAGIEIIQIIFGIGSFETEDIICNTCGAALGACIGYVLDTSLTDE